MSLGCNITEIKDNIIKYVKSIFGNKLNSDNTIDINSPQERDTIINNIKLIEEWLSKNLGPKLSQNWFIENDPFTIKFQFPTYVEDAINKKELIEKQKINLANDLNQINDIEKNTLNDIGINQNQQSKFEYLNDLDALVYDNNNIFDESNDFAPYLRHKKELLKNIEEKYDSYKILNRVNYGTEKYKNDTYTFENIITRLKDELEKLDITNIENVFSDVINELDYLDKTVDSLDTNVFKDQNIIDRIDFLNRMIHGLNINNEITENPIWDGKNYENYDSLIGNKISKLIKKLKDGEQQIIRNLLDNDVIYQSHKDQFTPEQIQKLFENRNDINFLQEYFLGINSNNDTIVTTLLNTTFQTNVQKTKQFARPFVESIRDLDKKLLNKKFDLQVFFEKDDSGIDTGNIIHKYSKNYFKKLYEYYDILKQFNQSNKDERHNLYNQKINWLKENTIVIDFRKLKYFKNIYGEEYSNFFTYSDEEMNLYENELKNTLGKIYDIHIQDLNKKLSEYENYKMKEESIGNKFLNKNIHSNSPWLFIQNYYSDNAFNSLSYTSGQSTYFTYNNSRYIEFIPKKTKIDLDTQTEIDSGYYNKNFDKVENDNDAYSYWENLCEIYSKHINPTYASMGQNISTMSWAKFERDFVEEIKKSENLIDFLKNVYHETIKAFRKIWVEQGYYSENSGIKSNYMDTTTREIRKLKKAFSLKNISEIQSLAKENNINYDNLSDILNKIPSQKDKEAFTQKYKNDLIDKIARKQVFQNYSTDLTKTTLALSDLASLHKARQETQFIADILNNFQKTIKKTNGKDRNQSNAKVESWINTNIYNKRAVSRGNPNDEFSGEATHRFWKYYSDTEKNLMKVLQSLKPVDSSNVTNYSFNLNNLNYSKKGNSYFETIEGHVTQISKETFEKALEDYINKEIENLGIGVSPASLMLGFMKVIINKALALNPISGLFNRSEGMFSNIIRDNMGDYWTRGNLKYAKRFLALANINKFVGKQLSLQSKQKYLQMQTYQKLLDELALFQDKKNELDRKDKESRFNQYKEKFNVFQFAVENPEFKNQSEIILSMLMDINIKDNDGNEFKFFDGTGFPAYKPGTLELRDEFNNDTNRSWETFALTDNQANDFFINRVKIEDTIKKTQGNYATLDSIKILDTNVWGRLLMLFMRWMPEHVNQRFGKRDIDIIQGKSQVIGRYRGLLGNAGAASIFGSLALGISFGPTGLLFGAGTAVLPFAIKQLYSKYVYNEKNIKANIGDLKTSLGFIQEILIQSLNLPMKITYLNFRFDDKLLKNNLLDNNKNLSPEQVNALKGMAQESAIMIVQLMLMIFLKSLLWDDDDNDDDYRRQLYNFIDNQGNQSINSLLMWSNPKTIIEDNSKLAMLRYLGDIFKFIDITNKYLKDEKTFEELMYQTNKLQPLPLPNAVGKAFTGQGIPGFDKKEYQSSQWFDKYSKSKEWNDEQKLKHERKKFKQDYEEFLKQKYEALDLPEEEIETEIKKEVRKRMNEYDVRKEEDESNTEAIERIDFDAARKEFE